MEQMIKYKDSIYNYVDGGVLKGYTKRMSIPEKFPYVGWYGAKMPHKLWQTILAFFAWTYDKSKDESLVHLYYNQETKEWLAWAPPQRGNGMVVKTEDDHPNWSQAEAFVGFVKIGTGHHHNSAPAFQSGTDSADECTGNGLHFTIGKMDKEFHDLHARVVFNGNMIETDLEEWIELAPKYANIKDLPPELLRTAHQYSLQSAAPKELEVPQQWMDNFIKTTYNTGYGSGAYGHNNHQGHTSAGNGVVVGSRDASGHTTMSGRVTKDGVEGYYSTVNGVTEFIAFNQQKKTGSDTNKKTPRELGETAIDALIRSGMTHINIALIAEFLQVTPRDKWTGDRDTQVIINIIRNNGLNPQWLINYIEELERIDMMEEYRQEQQQWAQ